MLFLAQQPYYCDKNIYPLSFTRSVNDGTNVSWCSIQHVSLPARRFLLFLSMAGWLLIALVFLAAPRSVVGGANSPHSFTDMGAIVRQTSTVCPRGRRNAVAK
jgi:hypothetical protein